MTEELWRPDDDPWWKRALLRTSGFYVGYVIRRTGRNVSRIVRDAQRGETLAGRWRL